MPVAVTTPGHLALLGDRAGIGVVADLLVDRQRFARQRRLIDAEIGAVDQFQIGGNDIAELDQHDVAGHEQLCLNILPGAVALDARLQRKALLQQGDGIVGLEFLPEADACIDEQHRENDDEIVPMAEPGRERRRDLDHPGDRPPEEAGEAFEDADMMFGEGVFAVLGKPALASASVRPAASSVSVRVEGGAVEDWGDVAIIGKN